MQDKFTPEHINRGFENPERNSQKLMRFAARAFQSIFISHFSEYCEKFGKINKKMVFEFCGSQHFSSEEIIYFLSVLENKKIIEQNRMFIKILKK